MASNGQGEHSGEAIAFEDEELAIDIEISTVCRLV
jgi:hypothetical protein